MSASPEQPLDPPPPDDNCPMCGTRFPIDVARCPSCGDIRLSKPFVEPRPLWQKILIAVAILIGVQWALIVLLFAVCVISGG